jgi:hypothetical protein
MIDEPESTREQQRAIGDPVSECARYMGRVTQCDERLDHASDGGFGQVGCLSHPCLCGCPIPVKHFEYEERPLNGFDSVWR